MRRGTRELRALEGVIAVDGIDNRVDEERWWESRVVCGGGEWMEEGWGPLIC